MNPEKPKINGITEFRSFLIGLVGHVDSGKTAIAKQLTQIVSTSGLDAHPQSKERGITIDLGFTSFIEDDLLITLVDAPGHADLIRSVVASARIIDGAIVVIDGKEGIQVQTAEHMVILELLGISNVIFVINKIDAVSAEKILQIKLQLNNLLVNTIFAGNKKILEVSAKNGTGISDLRKDITNWVTNFPKTPFNSNLSAFPIDHHFPKKGIGAIVTGTTQGSFSVGDRLTVIPHLSEVKVKNAQIYHQNVEKVPHGFRAGLVISGIEIDQLQRGDILTRTPKQYQKAELLEVEINFSRHFQKSIRFGSQIDVTNGMVTTSARVFPFYYGDQEIRMKVDEINYQQIKAWKKENLNYGAFLWFQHLQLLLPEEKLVLSKLDLSPSTLRFFGTAQIKQILPSKPNPEVHYIKTKRGKIKNPQYSDTTILVEGLAQSKEGAKTLIQSKLEPPFGIITNIFGGKGVVVAEKPKNHACAIGDIVSLRLQRSIKISKNKSYN
ncbi:MAG: GTP-binding protein [Promethearchaeota archaeon]|nr:MAG: GTP-binding protein [Candidatus Lokiarchaeota archaeon]